MSEYTLTLINTIMDNLIVPLIIAFGAALLYVVKHWLDRISKSVIQKNELEDVEKKNTIRSELLTMIDNQVESAVAANMKLADMYKETGKKLTDEQAAQLNESVMKMVMNSLPPELTTEDGTLNQLVGGTERLESIISTGIERHVYDYKLKKLQSATPVKKTSTRKKKLEECNNEN